MYVFRAEGLSSDKSQRIQSQNTATPNSDLGTVAGGRAGRSGT